MDPEQRLGSGQSGIHELQSHDFFTGIDWDQLTQQTPPRLLPYLPPIHHHNEEALRSNSEAMLFQPDRHYPTTPQIEPDMLLFSESDIHPSRDSQESDGVPWASNTSHHDACDNRYDTSPCEQQDVFAPPPRLRVMNDGVVRPVMPANSTTSSMSSSIMSILDEQARLHHPTPNRRHVVDRDTASITDTGSIIPPEMEPFSPRSLSRPGSSRATSTNYPSQNPVLYASTSAGTIPVRKLVQHSKSASVTIKSISRNLGMSRSSASLVSLPNTTVNTAASTSTATDTTSRRDINYNSSNTRLDKSPSSRSTAYSINVMDSPLM